MNRSVFREVKRAFESTYPCMAIACADVGGIIVDPLKVDTYIEGAEPCGRGSTAARAKFWTSPGWAATVIIVVALLALGIMGVSVACCTSRGSKAYTALVDYRKAIPTTLGISSAQDREAHV